MKALICGTCMYRELTGEAPDKCPVCYSPKEVFKEEENAITDPEGKDETLVKKHTPVITIEKKCGMIPEGCQDALIRIGETLHPAEAEHSIQFIDAYVDKKLVGRLHLTPGLNPAVVLHLNPDTTGKLAVVELCNLHGAWISETDL